MFLTACMQKAEQILIGVGTALFFFSRRPRYLSYGAGARHTNLEGRGGGGSVDALKLVGT